MALHRDLVLLSKELSENYHGDNPERLAFLAVYKDLAVNSFNYSERDSDRVLLGSLYFILELIRQKEYHGLSPTKKKTLLLKSTGSQLYTDIKQKLKSLSSDAMDDDQRLICMLKFYKHVKQEPESLINHLWPAGKNALLKDLIDMMTAVKQREAERIAILAEGEPKLAALEKSVVNLAQDYQQATTSRWFTNQARNDLISFINFIHKTRTDMHPSFQSAMDKDIFYIQTCSVRLGAFLFALLDIEREYKFLSPTRSKLFKNCLSALKSNSKQQLTSTSQINQDKKIEWLNALADHLHAVRDNKTYFNRATQYMNKKELAQIDKFQARLEEYLLTQKIKKRNPSKTTQYITQATSFAAQYGVSFAITHAVADIAIPSLTGVAIASGPVGLVVYGTGAVIMTQLGRLVGEKVLPSAVSYLYAYVLSKIGDAIADTTVGVATYTFSATREGLKTLLGHPALKEKDKEFLREWIDTLLEMPEEVVSLEEKQQIRDAIADDVPQTELSNNRLTSH